MGYERKQYVGNAAPSTLGGTIDADDLAITVADATNWPTGGANGKFVLCIGQATPTEEKILCTSRTGTSITISARGHDGTTPQAHSLGAAVAHVWDAESADQVNRFANLMSTKGDLIAHNGVNPVRVPTGAIDESTDGKVLQLRYAEPAGVIYAEVATFVLSETAPDPSGAIRLWYDEANRQLRPSDGATWLTPVQLPAFASRAAAVSYFDEAPGVAYYNIGLGFAELWNGTIWQPMWRPRFSDAAARDAYYTSPYDGAQAYLTGTHDETLYRSTEWISIGQKVTVSDSGPASPQVGDLWLEPVV